MKKTSVLIAAMLLAAMGIRAQIGKKPSKVQVEVERKPLQAIQIRDGELGDAVNLPYIGSDACTNGVERWVGGRLRPVSVDGAGGYTVSAILRGNFQTLARRGVDTAAAAGERLLLACPQAGGEMPPATERPDVEPQHSAMEAEGNSEMDLMYSIAPN